MSEQSAKPYLIRAICEWCADNALTPYLAVKVNGDPRVPIAFVKNGEIVLNMSTTATRKLTIDNEWIQFTARFNGSSQEVAVPMNAVSGIFAKETGYGFAFASPQDPGRPSPRPPRHASRTSPRRTRTAATTAASASAAARTCRSSSDPFRAKRGKGHPEARSAEGSPGQRSFGIAGRAQPGGISRCPLYWPAPIPRPPR